MLLSVIMVICGIALIFWSKNIAQKMSTSPPLLFKVLKIHKRFYSGDRRVFLFFRFCVIMIGIGYIIFAYFNYFGPIYLG